MVCTVSGTFLKPDGSVWASQTFLLDRLPVAVVAQSGSGIFPNTLTITSSSIGAVSFAVVPGDYTGRAVVERGTSLFSLVVPDTPTAALTDCLAAATASSFTGADLFTATTRAFATRAEFVTWAAIVPPATGTTVSAAGFTYRYIATGTAISDLAGWVAHGKAYPDHWGAVGNGTTDDDTQVTAWAAASVDKFYAVVDTIFHPDVRGVIDVALTGAGSTVYRIRDDDVAVTGMIRSTGAAGFGILVDAAAQGFHVRNMDIEASGFSVVVKPSNGTGGLARNGMFSGLNIHGGATTADVGVSFDGNTENSIAIGNTIRNIQRSDDSRPAHAYASGGIAGGGGPTADNRNILFGLSAVYDVAGNVAHIEDATPGIVTIGLMGQKIERGLEIINSGLPLMQTHMANSFAEWSIYAIDVVGTGSSKTLNFAFNLMDGAASTVASGPNVRINQQATWGINYLGNMHHAFTGNGLESTAEGRVHIDYNVFDTISGNAITGRSTISATRGLLIGSRNSFASVGGVIEKATSANVMGDQIAVSDWLVSNVASTDVLFQAKRSGYLTKVSCIVDGTPFGAGANATFTVVSRTAAGVETTLLSNSIPHSTAAYTVTEWTAENAQILAHIWAAGAVLLVRSNGAGGTVRAARIQIEFFEYN